MTSWPFKQITREMAAAIYNGHHEGVLMCDNKGHMIYYNDRMGELDGLQSSGVIGQHILAIYNLDADNCISTRCLAARKPILNEALYYRATEGKLVNAICNAYPIFENGQMKGVICYTSEYTALADRLEITARNYARHPYSRAVDDDHIQKAGNGAVHTMASIVGESPALKAALATAKVAARTSSSILICGETGCGKELFAQAIHNHSPRKARLFCPINCAAIPENLLEGVLFGTVKGAFTGALDKKGLFEVSSGGTLFLDEINSMPRGLQVKLLRAIQERRIRRVGGAEEIPVDLKIISSTNQSPDETLESGPLRSDLFYRLAVVILNLPPLRNRTVDIDLLTDFFIKKYNKKFNGRVRRVEPEFLNILRHYAWPGNVRELEHVIETSMNFAAADPNNDRTLGLRHLQSAHLRKFLTRTKLNNDQAAPAATASVPPITARPTGRISLPDELNRREQELLAAAMEQAEGNMARAAKRLGISRQNLYYRLKKTAGAEIFNFRVNRFIK